MNELLWVALAIFLLFGFVVFFGAPYVPAKLRDIKRAFDELYPVGEDDLLVDLGSGDGKVLREVARRGGRGLGVELNPVLVLISRLLSPRPPVTETRLGSMWQLPFPDATTIVYVFGTSRDIGRIERKVAHEATRLGRPLYVLSYGFELPDAALVKKGGAHLLYKITPLQPEKHKV